MSAVNRAFWAAGVKNYVGYDRAYVILKNRPVTNHRLSALVCDVDLHDESSFKDLGRRLDEAFPSDRCYQSSIDRWQLVSQAYEKYQWSKGTESLVRSQIPLSTAPWSTLRHVIADLLRTKGNYDPNKDEHVAIYLDVLIRRYLRVDKNRFESELQSSLLSVSLWMSAPRVGGQIVDQVL